MINFWQTICMFLKPIFLGFAMKIKMKDIDDLDENGLPISISSQAYTNQELLKLKTF